MNQPAKIQISNPPNGKNIEFGTKSSQSLIDRSYTPNSLQWLMLKALKILKAKQIELTEIVAIGLAHRYRRIKYATSGSIKPTIDVIAAIESNKKNRRPNQRPKGTCSNANGSVLNMRPVPLSGLKLFSNTKGKITSPANSAITVSADTIITALRPMGTFAGK
jgi:hypothetical protein